MHGNRLESHPPGAGLEPLPCTGARLRRLGRRTTVFYEQYLRPLGLRLTQYSVLVHLGSAPQALLELAERLEMDRTTLTRSLRPMIDRGWVVVSRGSDARLRLLSLSPDGLALRERARGQWARAQLALEAVLGREFTAQLNQALEEALARVKPALPEEN
ncbi:MAG: winged helix-turn-helix transcriptional regulator [Rhodocyclaceae bacterium]|nr:winged helix-turn-helix transcriptional regulator [Rhodocyclaceae bacterium]